jgi:hypothetical protein
MNILAEVLVLLVLQQPPAKQSSRMPCTRSAITSSFAATVGLDVSSAASSRSRDFALLRSISIRTE